IEGAHLARTWGPRATRDDASGSAFPHLAAGSYPCSVHRWGHRMDHAEFVWDHFKFNAEQRLKAFNFFLVLSIFADGGVFTALAQCVAPGWVMLLGGFIVLLAVVFFIVDKRSQELLRLTIPALKAIEAQFPESSRLFAIDQRGQGRFLRYSTAFLVLLLS